MHGFPNLGSMDPYSQHYSLNAHWNMCQFGLVFETLFPIFEDTSASLTFEPDKIWGY